MNDKIRIGIDGFPFVKNPSGVGKYYTSLVEALIDHYPDYEYYCYSNRDVFLSEKLRNKVIIRKDNGKISLRLKPAVWLKGPAKKLINKDEPDYYFSSNGLFPLLNKLINRVALVHDLNYLIVPETMGRLQWLSNYLFLKRDVRSADYIVTNSFGTSDKLISYFGVKNALIIPPPTSPIYKVFEEIELNRINEKFGLNFPYLLTVGNLEPRKNLILTIDVFLKLVKCGKHSGHKLVVVGSGGWKNTRIIALCKSNSEHIIRLGYVEENDLPGIYNGATAFLFPSIYEGFGMPVREAIHCGCPVICTDLPELRESSYQKAVFIKNNDFESYLKAMSNILSSDRKCLEISDINNKTDFSELFTLFRKRSF